ncbi:sulfotransferase family 2 domain-containing protein [Alisedimentitalea sp. MJ-SS2]|uniref:sulfotransferase family 2 domain-containing protein n=1 Tax=Aliisedimentitalea sp. MJ-SS2 TaxID=3049795 RepID=UPI0029127789|nr:sulfotransferase family 2 domain-containing protein [Alisedimentitalea sp. MJ-SS2]MDU8928476.1 sulfotransferase family 2 domain-containing protein [Alisedimentitalea sp. MJ-SS2]
MISYRRGFVFVHIPKTGGKSVRKALRAYTLNPSERFVQYFATRTSRRDVYGIDVATSHATARRLRNIIGSDTWHEFYSFAFVRNPWSRVVSEYHFHKKRPDSAYHDLATNGTLEDFVTHLHAKGAGQQVDFVYDDDGNQIVDFVGKVENYAEDFARVCARLRVVAALPHKNQTRHGSYRDELTPMARDLVSELYADDIAAFSYRFE